MKSKFLLALTALLLAMAFVSVSAQTNDFGNTDTIRINCPAVTPTVVEGDSIAVQVYIYNDEKVGGFSLPINYNSDFVEFSSYVYGASVPGGGQPQVQKEPASNRVLFGWLSFTPTVFIAANPGGAQLLLTMYFKVLPGATPGKIDLQPTFIPPAGPLELSIITDDTYPITPEYKDCGTADIHLPVMEFGGPVLPETYALSQNNPNPFNPSTTIDFALPRAAKTTIEIFNILGQKVTTLVDEYLSAGNKRIEWNGTDATGRQVASGVYLYRMTANDFTQTRKMMLMK